MMVDYNARNHHNTEPLPYSVRVNKKNPKRAKAGSGRIARDGDYQLQNTKQRGALACNPGYMILINSTNPTSSNARTLHSKLGRRAKKKDRSEKSEEVRRGKKNLCGSETSTGWYILAGAKQKLREASSTMSLPCRRANAGRGWWGAASQSVTRNTNVKLAIFGRIQFRSNLGWKVDVPLGYEFEMLFSTLDLAELQPS